MGESFWQKESLFQYTKTLLIFNLTNSMSFIAEFQTLMRLYFEQDNLKCLDTEKSLEQNGRMIKLQRNYVQAFLL